MDENYPGRILLCEANQEPESVRPYFGDGDEFHMAFHFPIMPRIFMALKKGRAQDLRDIQQRTPTIPDNCQWCTFLRNHDELTLEMVSTEERQWMWDQYAPEPRMRQNLGIRRRLAPLLDNDPRKIKLIHSLLFTLPGSPIIYYGDEIGMGDDIWLPDRNGVRTAMQWNSGLNAGFSDARGPELFSPIINDDIFGPTVVNVEVQQKDPASLWNAIRKMLAVRKGHRSFGLGAIQWVDCHNDRIASFRREFKQEKVWVVHNLSDSKEAIILGGSTPGSFDELLTDKPYQKQGSQFRLDLEPFQFLWLKEKSATN
jgi:maltose alpha-D-glucosyltransferase/alpha-amylase